MKCGYLSEYFISIFKENESFLKVRVIANDVQLDVIVVNSHEMRFGAYCHGLFQNHAPQTLCDGHSPDASSTRSGIPEHDASIYEQTVNKSTEYILQEVAGSKGTAPPVNLPTSAVGFIACNWGLMIDQGARLLFPLAYAAFIVTYFSFFHF